MLNIKKKSPPRSFTDWKAEQKNVEGLNLSDYEGNYSDLLKGEELREVKKHLCDEQGWICCYCMGRITPENMRLEHWATQQDHKDKKFEYSNFLAACSGGEGTGNEHCDVSRGNTELQFNPSVDDVESLVQYTFRTGEITSAEMDFSNEINNILKLNSGYIPSNRKAALETVILNLKNEGFTRANIQRKIAVCEREGKRPAYVGIILAKLRKKLDSM